MKIVKARLRDEDVQALLSHSVYMPTEEKLSRIAEGYEADGDISAFACVERGRAIGIIVLRHKGDCSYEIMSIAVDPAFRGRGVGSMLMDSSIRRLMMHEVVAETDADAAGFYRNCGFEVISLGEKFPGTIRYLCVKLI
jgi:ribosomal protein S18 acetylase RimI-like enzyme